MSSSDEDELIIPTHKKTQDAFTKGLQTKISDQQFVETGYFFAEQFLEMIEWIGKRKEYVVEVHGWGQYDANGDGIRDHEFEFEGRILKKPSFHLFETNLLIYITEFQIDKNAFHVPYILNLTPFSHKGLSDVANVKERLAQIPILKTIFKAQRNSRLFITKFLLKNRYLRDTGNEIGFAKMQFENAMVFIDRYEMENQIEAIMIGNLIKRGKKVPAIMQGTVVPNQIFKNMIIIHTATVIKDFLAFNPISKETYMTPADKNTSSIPMDKPHEEKSDFLIEGPINMPVLRRHSRSAFSWFKPHTMYFALGKTRKSRKNIIEVENLTVQFGKRVIIEKASFVVEKGSIMGIIGESGAGKSTTVKAFLGELDYTGKITIMGINAKETKRLAPHIGYVPQDLSLIYHDFNALENMIHFGRQYDLEEEYITRRSKQILKDLNIAPYMDKPVGELSGGQKRRVSIAMAMVHDPTLLILDEPTSGLDPMTRFSLWRFLDRINKLFNITLVVISHYLDEIEYSDKSAIYLKGKGFFDYDSPANLKKKLPGQGKSLEITLESIEQRAMTVLKTLPIVEEIVQRGERIRLLSDLPMEQLRTETLDLLEKEQIAIYRCESDVEVDIMDYFTIFSRKLGSGQQFHTKSKLFSPRKKD
jgi:ABC-2 type transport system ATP-binding protein